MDDNEVKITFGGVEISGRSRNFQFTDVEQEAFDRAAKETLRDIPRRKFTTKTLTITLVYQRPKVRFFYWLPKTRSCRMGK